MSVLVNRHYRKLGSSFYLFFKHIHYYSHKEAKGIFLVLSSTSTALKAVSETCLQNSLILIMVISLSSVVILVTRSLPQISYSIFQSKSKFHSSSIIKS